eukprot:11226779-Lingulodinium_polyedra.AAC.1
MAGHRGASGGRPAAKGWPPTLHLQRCLGAGVAPGFLASVQRSFGSPTRLAWSWQRGWRLPSVSFVCVPRWR